MVWSEELRHYVGPKTIDKVSEDRVYVLDDDGIDDGTGVYTKQYSTAQCKRYQEDPDGGQFMNGLNSRLNDPRSGLASNEFTIYATELLDSTDPRTRSPEAEAAKKKEIEQLIERGTWRLALRSELPKDANVLGARFVISVKNSGDEDEFFKARYVVQGHRDR
jgi:hypothetical protein